MNTVRKRDNRADLHVRARPASPPGKGVSKMRHARRGYWAVVVATVVTVSLPARGQEQQQPAPDTQPTVRLLNAGQGAKRELRYQFQGMQAQNMAMDMTMAMETKMGEFQQKMEMPTMRMVMQVTPGQRTNDELTYQFELVETSVAEGGTAPPMVAQAMRTSLAGTRGMKGTVVIDSRGVTKSVDMQLPAGVDPQVQQQMENMKQSLAQMSAPLPIEPVGVGAQWEVTMPIRTPMFSINQVAGYTLQSMDGDQLVLAATIRQDAPRQQIQQPGMPPEVKIMLESMQSTGTGTTKADLSRLVPQAQSHLESQIKMVTSMQGQTQNTEMNMKVDVKIQPAAAAATTE
jgi:hypothetical protein